MNTRRKSKIWLIPTNELKNIVVQSKTIAEILRNLNIAPDGNYQRLKARLIQENIDFTHIPLGLNANKGQVGRNKGRPLEEILIKNSPHQNRTSLKKRLIREEILTKICYECGLTDTWNGKPLVLVLDHINGINDDYRKKNLRLLCPNCNSQQATFCKGQKGLMERMGGT